MKRLFAASLVLAILLACADEASAPGSGGEITGNITSIDGNAADIDSFTIDEGGAETEIFIKKGFDYGFDLVHLYEHQEQDEPVRVTIETEDGKPFATAIDDV